jgi:hypothetical protein
MRNNSLLDELSRVINDAHARESEAHMDEHDRAMNAERLATATREQQLVELAMRAAENFVKLEERRVKALEAIAFQAEKFVQVLQYSADRLHNDALQGFFRK